jgi:uncharacterized membrane protein YfcA
MEFVIIPLVALGASLLTFFSGFGLGTLLTPVFAFFFPLELSVALTAIVHFLNNIFKYSLIGRYADKNIVIKFGVPAALSAFVGAWVLGIISEIPALYDYTLLDHHFKILPVKLIFSVLIIFFTLFEILPFFNHLKFNQRFLGLGGVLSGFFGGLSGHQGALRSAFLSRADLSKEQFIATGNAIALLIDISRIGIYSRHMTIQNIHSNLFLVFLATLSAFLGAYLGNKLLKKLTIESIKIFVSFSLFLFGLCLGIGII